jgi:hypothetical protein
LREIVKKTAEPFWASQELRQQWGRLIVDEGIPKVITRLEAIRDPIRAANQDFNKLLYDEQHYRQELDPVITGYDRVFGWNDSAMSDLIAALKKYENENPRIVIDLTNDRFTAWNNEINDRIGGWIGHTDARITKATKEWRERPHQ